MSAVRFARERNIRFSASAWACRRRSSNSARNVAGLVEAGSGEFDEACPQKVIDFMPGQSAEGSKGRHVAAQGRIRAPSRRGSDARALLW